MPSSLNLDGLRVFRPGIYGVIDASALGGSGVSTGNVALVGSFPTIEANKPLTFTSARAVRDFDPDDLDLQTMAKLAFAPSGDVRVPGGAGTLTICNSTVNTQASYPFGYDADTPTAKPSLSLKSKLWGTSGNQVFASLAQNSVDAEALDVTIKKGSSSETYKGLTSGPVANFFYEGSEITASTISVDNSNFSWNWTHSHAFVGGADQSLTASDLIVQNGQELQVGFADGSTGFASGTLKATVTGEDKTGVAVTGTAEITFAAWNADNAIKVTVESGGSAVEWGRVSTVLFQATTNGANAVDGTISLYGKAYDLTLSDFSYVGQIVSLINNNQNVGFHATALHPRINKIPAVEMDKKSDVSVVNAAATPEASATKLTVRSDLWAIVDALSASNIVDAARATGANMRPAAVSGSAEQGFFTGGSAPVLNAADTALAFDVAFEAIEFMDIQIVVPISSDIQIGAKLSKHCIDSALAGYERCSYFGAPAGQTLAQMFSTYTSKLNSRHVAVAGQEVYVEDSTGALAWKSPVYMAVMLAGMQAGTSVATPLTWKRPSVFNVRADWDGSRDASEAIQKGIVNISKDTLGFKIERSVTSWLEDDNPIYSEISANESVNTSVRDLRAALQIRIGDAVFGKTANKMKSVVEARLNQQVTQGFIKAWQNVSVEDLGDTIKISYECAATEPLNFIKLTAFVVRIAGE